MIFDAHRSRLTAGPLRRTLGVAVLGASLVVTTAAQSQVSLPTLGDTASEEFNLGTERALGDAIMRDIRGDPAYLDDPVLIEYLQSLWQPLLAAARVRGDLGEDLFQRFPYAPFLLRDRSVNAFALPGGYMGVHLGLMAITQTRDELASVLAHEMTHINQRHIARNVANSKQQSLISTAATIIGILVAARSGGGGDAANALIAGGQAIGIQGQLNFSREMEREADRIGAATMASAGFLPSGMAAMFERLQNASRLNDNGNYPYLRSHPLTTDRIGEARARDESAAGIGSAAPLPAVVLVSGSIATPLEHTAALARARVLMDVRSDALNRWQRLDGDLGRTDATRNEQFANAYSSALASSLQRDWSRADASIERAMTIALGTPEGGASGLVVDGQAAAPPPPDRRGVRAVLLLAVESQLQRGDALQAQALLSRLTRPLGPTLPDASNTSRPVMLLAAQVALALGRGKDNAAVLHQSAEQLQGWLSRFSSDSPAWFMLSRVSGQLGFGLRAIRADAESRYAVGDLRGAIDRLRAGQKMARNGSTAGDFVESSVIDSRLRLIEAQRKQLLTEQLGYR